MDVKSAVRERYSGAAPNLVRAIPSRRTKRCC